MQFAYAQLLPKNVKAGYKQQVSSVLILGSDDYMIKFLLQDNKSTMGKKYAYCWVYMKSILGIFSELVANRDYNLIVLCFIFRFAVLASRMEQYIQGQSRDLIDKAYTKLVSFIPFCCCTSLHSWYYICCKLGS